MPDLICANCSHPLSEHCEGGKHHGNYKEEARMVPLKYRARTEPCRVQHCQQALCCCTEFKEGKRNPIPSPKP